MSVSTAHALFAMSASEKGKEAAHKAVYTI